MALYSRARVSEEKPLVKAYSRDSSTLTLSVADITVKDSSSCGVESTCAYDTGCMCCVWQSKGSGLLRFFGDQKIMSESQTLNTKLPSAAEVWLCSNLSMMTVPR